MLMSVLALGIVALLGYIWLTRGFFSALLNLVCVLIAGAIAFAVWEPVSYFLLQKAPTSGPLSFLGGAAWGLGLALPFAVVLALLRVATDAVCKFNTKVNAITDYIGGGVCGAIAGVVVAGIAVLSVGMLRVSTDFLGHAPLDQSPQGIVRQKGLWVPVDTWTGKLYGLASQSALSTSRPLGVYYPNLAEVPVSLRMTDGDGRAKNTVKPDDFQIITRYKVAGELNQLMTDKWRERANAGPQRVRMISGDPYPPGTRIEGVVVKFLPGAMEKFGQVVIGNGPVRLLVVKKDGEGRITDADSVHPFAVAAQAEAVDAVTGRPKFGRFGFESKGLFIASKGGSTEATMAFEFLVAPGWEPVAIYVRNVRRDLDSMPANPIGDTVSRDTLIESGELFTGTTTVELDKEDMLLVKWFQGRIQRGQSFEPPRGLSFSSNIGFTIQLGTQNNRVQITDTRMFQDGVQVYTRDQMQQIMRNAPPNNLRVERFYLPDDAGMMQLDVTAGQQISLVMRSVQAADFNSDPPRLVDKNGTGYQAVGYIYEDRELVEVRYTPGRPITSLADIGRTISISRSDQKLKLIFRVSMNAEIVYFAMGNRAIAQFDPPVPLYDRAR